MLNVFPQQKLKIMKIFNNEKIEIIAKSINFKRKINIPNPNFHIHLKESSLQVIIEK